MKLILFDQSSVFGNDEETELLLETVEEYKLDKDKFMNRFYELLARAEVDEFGGEYVWDTVLKEFNIPKTGKEMVEEMGNRKKLYPDVMEIIKQLRKNYKTAYYTNYNRDFWKYMEQFNLDEYFDFGKASFEIKIRKPSRDGFQIFLDHFNLKAEETLFVDDSEKNINAAKEMGMNILHFTDRSKFREQLIEMGIEL